MRRTFTLGIVFLFPVCGMFAQAPSQIQKPFSRVELLALVVADPRQAHIERVVEQRGIGFHLSEDYLDGLRAAGAREPLVFAVRKAPALGDPASLELNAVTQENQALQHLVQASRLKHAQAWKEA